MLAVNDPHRRGNEMFQAPVAEPMQMRYLYLIDLELYLRRRIQRNLNCSIREAEIEVAACIDWALANFGKWANCPPKEMAENMFRHKPPKDT